MSVSADSAAFCERPDVGNGFSPSSDVVSNFSEVNERPTGWSLTAVALKRSPPPSDSRSVADSILDALLPESSG